MSYTVGIRIRICTYVCMYICNDLKRALWLLNQLRQGAECTTVPGSCSMYCPTPNQPTLTQSCAQAAKLVNVYNPVHNSPTKLYIWTYSKYFTQGQVPCVDRIVQDGIDPRYTGTY